MAETDILYEFGREPGFSCSGFGPERSHMLHTYGEVGVSKEGGRKKPQVYSKYLHCCVMVRCSPQYVRLFTRWSAGTLDQVQ